MLGLLVLLPGCASGSDQLSAQSPLPAATAITSPADPSARPVPPSPLGLPPPSLSPSPSPSAHPVTSPVQVATAGSASAGPGRVSSPAASPSPRPTPSVVAGTVTVTDDDNGATVRLARGQRLRVQLTQGTWDPPVSSADAVVVRRSSTGGYPSDQPVDATFEAVGAGRADVTAQSDAACFHTEPRCLMAQREWRVTVVVS